MNKTKNFETYIKESLEGLIPLDSEEIVISEEEEDETLDEFDTDDEEDTDEEDADSGEFELDTVPADEPVLEPEENLGGDEELELEDDVEDNPMDLEDTMPNELGDESSLIDDPGMLEDPTMTEGSGGKTLYLYCGASNVTDVDDPSFTAVDEITNMMQGCDCETIKVYQLNIQPVAETEAADGMEMIYDQIKDADVVVMAGPIQDGSASSLSTLVLDRLAQHYKSGELKNKIFGSVFAGDEGGYQSVKSSVINKANNLGMIVAPDANILIGGEGTDYQKFVDSVTGLRDATGAIRTESVVEEPLEDGVSDVLSFDEFAGAAEDVADEFGDEMGNSDEDLPMDAALDDENMEDDVIDEEPLDDENMEDDMPSEELNDDEIVNFADFEKEDDSEEPSEDEFVEDPEEEEINVFNRGNVPAVANEEKEWNLPEAPKELKNPVKIKTFKEVTSSKNADEFTKKPESSKMAKNKIDTTKGKTGTSSIKKAETKTDSKEFISKKGTSKMPSGKVDTEKGKSKETTIKGGGAAKASKELIDGKGTSSMPAKKAKDTDGAKHTDSGVKVEVKYFSGMKGGKGKEGAKKAGDTIQNFSDWTKRI